MVKSGTATTPCRFFQIGTCTAGASCQFLHERDAKAPQVRLAARCKFFFERGFCAHGSACAFSHEAKPPARSAQRCTPPSAAPPQPLPQQPLPQALKEGWASAATPARLGKDKELWAELLADERAAAARLGYSAESWENGDPPTCAVAWLTLRPEQRAAAMALGYERSGSGSGLGLGLGLGLGSGLGLGLGLG